MPYIEYAPEIIDSKLGDQRGKYPITIEPKSDLRDDSIAFTLQVNFQPKIVTAIGGSDKFYLGIRNATIEVSAENGTCTESTKDILLDIDYSVESSKSTETKDSSSTEAQITYEPLSAKVGDTSSLGKTDSKKTSGKFSSQEKKLSSKVMNNRVQWYYALPDHESLISNLLDEVLTLNASFKWYMAPLKGSIILKPGKLEIFDAERERFPKYKGIAMLQLLYNRLKVHSDDVVIKYEVC